MRKKRDFLGQFTGDAQNVATVLDKTSAALFIYEGTALRYVNPPCERLTGYSRDELLGMGLWDIVHPESRRYARDQEFARRRGEMPTSSLEFKIVRKDGEERWVDFTAATIRFGGRTASVGTAYDITERKEAEEALRRWKDIFFHTKMAIAVAAADSDRLDLVNPAFAEQHGYAVEEITGRPIADVYPPELRETFRETIRTAHERGHAVFETVHLRKDGTVFPVLVDLTAVAGQDGRHLYRVANVLDLTERKRAEEALLRSEEQLRHSQKMEAMGRLAGGVAHDFNNQLTAITGYTDLILGRLTALDPRRREMEEIRKAAERAAALTRQLLAFSRKQVLQLRTFGLNEVVANLDDMLRRLIGEDISLTVTLGERPWTVKADPGQVEQVIINLAINARDAMPAGGKLSIETANVVLGEWDIPGLDKALPGSYVMLAVADTGHGMDEETRSHLFEPFFTTKEVGKGTGLGLATVYGIVRQSGGYIAVSTREGAGTTFRIYFPRAGDVAETPSPAPAPVVRLEGRETVLLVEDEPVVRMLVREVLANHGYTVLVAPAAQEALATAEAAGKPVDLLITDVVMPGMSGREVADALKARYPGIKVLFMSGYTDDAILHHGIVSGSQAFLPKPFTIEGIARKAREVLDGGASG